MKTTLVHVIMVATFLNMSSCMELNKRMDEKVRLFDKRAGQLDSMLANELKKVQQLDTIILDEIEKARQLDSIIQKSKLTVDSLLNRE